MSNQLMGTDAGDSLNVETELSMLQYVVMAEFKGFSQKRLDPFFIKGLLSFKDPLTFVTE